MSTPSDDLVAILRELVVQLKRYNDHRFVHPKPLPKPPATLGSAVYADKKEKRTKAFHRKFDPAPKG